MHDSSYGASIINVNSNKHIKHLTPKIMGFFENEEIQAQKCTRNQNLKNAKASSNLYRKENIIKFNRYKPD